MCPCRLSLNTRSSAYLSFLIASFISSSVLVALNLMRLAPCEQVSSGCFLPSLSPDFDSYFCSSLSFLSTSSAYPLSWWSCLFDACRSWKHPSSCYSWLAVWRIQY